MKKMMIVAVMLGLMAGPAWAAIQNTAHDMSGLGTFTNGTDGYASAETDRLCVYCHTPHGGDMAKAVLWNRGEVDLSGLLATEKYSSSTYQGGVPDYTIGDAKLCMTCHDGSLDDSLTNLNGAASGVLTPKAGAFTLTIPVGRIALLGTDFSDDHPVGFTYNTALSTADGELHDPATTPAVMNMLFNTVATGGEMWCSSCHDVHDNSNVPFLRQTNAQSALCLVCHDK